MSPLDPALRARLLEPPTGVVDVVLDTDATNEIDDQFALVWALLRPDRLRVLGIHAAPYSHEDRLVGSGSLVTELERGRFEATLARWDGELATTGGEGVARRAGVPRRRALVGSSAPVLDGSRRSCRTSRPPSAATPPSTWSSWRTRTGSRRCRCSPSERPPTSRALCCWTRRSGALVVVWTSAYPSFWPTRTRPFNLQQDVAAGRVLLESGVRSPTCPATTSASSCG
jgi:hypothetical protein